MSDTTVAKPSATPAAKNTKSPIAKRKFGNISVAVFAREVSRSDGSVFTAKDFVLQKSWKDKDDQWQNQSITFNPRELFAVQQALSIAFIESYDQGIDQDEEA